MFFYDNKKLLKLNEKLTKAKYQNEQTLLARIEYLELKIAFYEKQAPHLSDLWFEYEEKQNLLDDPIILRENR